MCVCAHVLSAHSALPGVGSDNLLPVWMFFTVLAR